MKRIIILSILFLALGFSQAVYKGGEVRLSPRLLSYQGFVTDTLGNPINDTLDFLFRIYSASSGGTTIWTEIQLDMIITKGIFHAVLGSVTPIPDSVFTKSTNRWLEMRIAGQTMSPRTQIMAAGYAFTATYSDTAEYARSAPAIDSCRISANSHKLQGKDTTALDLRYINEGQVAGGVLGGTYPNPSLADNVVTTSKILDSAVTMVKINRSGANPGQVIKWNGTAWQPDIDANFPDNDWIRSGGKVYPYNLTDSVGIGMTTPRYALDVNGVICGGVNDTVNAFYSGVFSGYHNLAGIGINDTASVIAGGYNNTIYNSYSFIGGGINNTVVGMTATIAGGSNGIASAMYSVVGGGRENVALYDYACVGGGWGDSAMGYCGGVFSGYSNLAGNATDDTAAVVAGGYDNSALAKYAFVGGGLHNSAGSNFSTVVGGDSNTTTAQNNATIVGGHRNYNSGPNAFIGAGQLNYIAGNVGVIGGGYADSILSGSGVIGGGYANKTFTNIGYGYQTIGGGQRNAASGQCASITGGFGNYAGCEGLNSYYQTIGGGYCDTAKAYAGGVFCGYSNIAGDTVYDTCAVVAGGYNNSALAKYSFVGGGRDNSAEGAYTFTAGRRAKAYNQGCFVWGDATDADVSVSVDNRWVARCSGGVYFYTNAAMTAGVYVAAGGGSWASVSDRDLKENFNTVDGAEILNKLAAIPIQTWNYKSQDKTIRHIGPVAQDFAGFGVGEDDKHITTIDADGIALAAIQELNKKLEKLEAENRELRQRIERMENK